MKPSLVFATGLLATLALAAPAGAVVAGIPEPPQEMIQNGVPYLSGGVGRTERELLSTLDETDYDLRLVFGRADGAYVANVKVVVWSGADRVLDAVSPGPWFYANLPDGTYRIRVDGEGQSFTRTVTVARGRQASVEFGGWSSAVASERRRAR